MEPASARVRIHAYVDALRPHLAQIEAHTLQQAGIVFDATTEPGKLRVVVG